MDFRFRPHNYQDPRWETGLKLADEDKKYKYMYSDEGCYCSVRDYDQPEEDTVPNRYIWKTYSEAQPNDCDNSSSVPSPSRASSPSPASPPNETVEEVDNDEDVAFSSFKIIEFYVPVVKQEPESSTSSYQKMEFRLPVAERNPKRNDDDASEDYRVKMDEMVKQQRKQVVARIMEDLARDAEAEVVLLRNADRYREGPFWDSVVPDAFRWKEKEGTDQRIMLGLRPYIPVDLAVWDMIYQNKALITP